MNLHLDLNGSCSQCGTGVPVLESAQGWCTSCIEAAKAGSDNQVLTPPPPASIARPRLDRSQRPQGRGLAGTLFDLIIRAEQLNDRAFHPITLQHGLRVEVGIGECFNLRLSRADSYPSTKEWETVANYLPDAYKPETAVEARQFKHHRDGRYYLAAEWPFKRRSL